MATNKVAATLARCIEQSLTTDTHEFQWDKFFPLWFRKEGSPYFFLFRRHLGVTNTQYAELFSLLQAYAKPSIPLLFHTTEQTKTTVVEMLGTLLDASLSTATRAKQIREFSNQYVSIFQSTIAVDMFYCSCAVFLPPGLDVDINGICADSGYIHSAGKSVYVRNLKKARIGGFEAALSAHLNEIEPENFPVPFVVYAHEDFSEFDRDSREQISRGIDSTKLYVEKMSMGSYRLAQIVQDMRAKFADKLEVPEAGSYIEKHEFSARRTIWLICDRSMSGNNPMYAGGERYYICYEQLVKNSNPFYQRWPRKLVLVDK